MECLRSISTTFCIRSRPNPTLTGSPERQNWGGELEELAGRAVATKELVEAIAESNAARAAVRKLLRLRNDAPRVRGREVLPLIGAYWLMARAEYAKLAAEAAENLAQREPLAGARLVLMGAPLDHPRLHAALESHGAIVVAEDDWWGARSAGTDIEAGNDALRAIFEHYYLDAPGPRVFPPKAADRWFRSRMTESVDGVVFYLPPKDYVAGWDYPRQKHFLDRLGIPSMVVGEDSDAGELSSESHESIERFVHETVRRI